MQRTHLNWALILILLQATYSNLTLIFRLHQATATPHLRLKAWNKPFLWLPQQITGNSATEVSKGSPGADPSSHSPSRQQLRAWQIIFSSLLKFLHTLWGSRHLWSAYSPAQGWSRAFPDTSKCTEGLLLLLYPQTARGWRMLPNCARSKQFSHCTQQEEQIRTAPRWIFACDY